MKKAIVVIALVIACFIPTYILVFQAVRTAVPDASLDEIPLSPVYVRWSLTGDDGETAEVSQNPGSAERRYEKSDPVLLEDITDLSRLTWSLEPSQVRVAVYDLTEENTFLGFTTLQELPDHAMVGTTHHLQVVVLVDWHFTGTMTARAAYSFEVNG